MYKYQSESTDRLFRAILGLGSLEECYAFFDDLCTIKEIKDMAQRLEGASMLLDGANYQTICAKLGLSTATISRISRCLNYGSGGYAAAIGRLGKEEAPDDANPEGAGK